MGHSHHGPAALALGPVTAGKTPFGVRSATKSARGPASDKQWRPNLPHITTVGLKPPLPLNKHKKELLVELINQGHPKDTISCTQVQSLQYDSPWHGGAAMPFAASLAMATCLFCTCQNITSKDPRLPASPTFYKSNILRYLLNMHCAWRPRHFDAADTKDAEGLSASRDQRPHILDFNILLCLASLHELLPLPYLGVDSVLQLLTTGLCLDVVCWPDGNCHVALPCV